MESDLLTLIVSESSATTVSAATKQHRLSRFRARSIGQTNRTSNIASIMRQRLRIPLVRVFLASPGDVADERAAAFRILQDLPYESSLRDRVAIQVVAWDTIAGPPMEASMTPQQAINSGLPKPSECDVVIGIFWSRLGSPITLDGIQYGSGTAFELSDALAAADGSPSPRVLIYHRSDPVMLDVDDAHHDEHVKERRLLQAYLRDLAADPDTGEAKRGINTYVGVDGFRDLLSRHLREVVTDVAGEAHGDFDVAASPGEPAGRGDHVATFYSEWEGPPFRGLQVFEDRHEQIFFGRDADTDRIVDRVREGHFCAIVGASGSGKSSLVRAGVIPRLRRTSKLNWITATMSPDQLGDGDPTSALLASLAIRGETGILDSATSRSVRRQNDFGLILEALPTDHRLMLVVDQMEELVTTVDAPMAQSFVSLIVQAVRHQSVSVLATLRGDFYADMLELDGIGSLLRTGTYALSAPTPAELREMITKPAERARLSIDAGLVDRIVDDSRREPGSLALVSYTLEQLHSASPTGALRTKEYERLGGVSGTIAAKSEELFSSMSVDVRATMPRVFGELVEVDPRGTGTRRRAPLSLFGPGLPEREFVDTMVEGRLLTVDREAADSYVEVAHEALLRSWERLAHWIAGSANQIRTLRSLREAAHEWDRIGRPDSHLWPHERLLTVYDSVAAVNPVLDDVTRDFIRPEVERLKDEWPTAARTAHRSRVAIDRLQALGEPGLSFLVERLSDLSSPVLTEAEAEIIRAIGKHRYEPGRSAVDRRLAVASDGALRGEYFPLRVRKAAVVAAGRLPGNRGTEQRLELLAQSLKGRPFSESDLYRSAVTALNRMRSTGSRRKDRPGRTRD